MACQCCSQSCKECGGVAGIVIPETCFVCEGFGYVTLECGCCVATCTECEGSGYADVVNRDDEG